jgi:hypothetical protein
MGRFKDNLGELLGGSATAEKKGKGRPKGSSTRIASKASEEGCRESETRATFIINEDLLDKLKAVAYWERVKIKEAMEEALGEYLGRKNVKARPEKERRKEQEDAQRRIKTPGAVARMPKY